MAGFGTTMSKLIEDDREYYRELATKKRDYLQTYGTKAVLDRDEKANSALSVFNTLVTAGIPEEDLRYVLDTTGVPGLAQLSSTLKSRSDLTKAEIAGLVKKSKDYVAENPDEDISDILRRAYGLYESTDKPVEREANIFSAVLGLDSRMMEREALNDVYIDGFKGTDLYAIMARGGPKSGEALSLNLPTKPPSTQTLAASFKSLTTKFETSIDGKIRAATRANNFPLVEKLEKLKGRGVEGIYDYATLPEIGDPTLLDFAERIELETPGAISRNSIYLGGFTSQFNSWYGDQQDDTKLEGNGQPLPAEIIDTGEIKTYTPTELRTALSEGELAVGSKVVVNGNEVVITQALVDKGGVKGPGMTTGEGLTLEKDGGSLLPPVEEETSLPDRSAMEAKLQEWMSYLTTPSGSDAIPEPSDGEAVPETSSTDSELDMTHGGTQIESFVPFALGMIPTDSYTTTGEAYDLNQGLKSLAAKFYDFNREEIESWFKTYAEDTAGGDLELTQGKEKSFYDGVYNAYKELYKAREIKKALARSDAIDDKLALQKRETALNDFDLPVPPRDLPPIDTPSVNTESDLKAAIAKRIGSMPPDYKVQVANTVSSLNEVLKAFETNVNVGIENAIDTVSVDNLAEAISNMSVRMFDTVVGDETLEERIMQNEGQRNRAAAFAKLQEQFAALTLFPERTPVDVKDIDPYPTMPEMASEFLHSTQDKINASIASTAKAFLAKLGIGNSSEEGETKVEPLVARPKKPKEMTTSDKARLQRAQKAKELSGDSSLLEMLVNKYGLALVQKEMGY